VATRKTIPVLSGPCTAGPAPPHLEELSVRSAVRERWDNAPLAELSAGPPRELQVNFLGVMVRKRWERGRILGVALNGATVAVRRQVFSVLEAGWSASCNISFREAPWAQAECRFTLNPPGGNWSGIGTDLLVWPAGQPTGNLGQLDRGTILHEFGHAIGFPHGQQLPNFGVPLNWPYLIAWARQTQGWDEATLRAQYNRVPPSEVEFSPVNDLKSVMQYWIEPQWTLDGTSVPINDDLSAEDRAFCARESVYGPRDPGAVSPPPMPAPPPVVAETLPTLAWSRALNLPYAPGSVVRVRMPVLRAQARVTVRVRDDRPLATPIVDVVPLGGQAVRLPMRPYRGEEERCTIVAGPGDYELRIGFRGGSPERFTVAVTRG
jgi:hypothetical protein